MLSTIAKFFRSQWQRLTLSRPSHRLSWFAVILAFAIDAYVLSLLLDGMNRTAQLIDHPYPTMTRYCVELSVGYMQQDADEAVSNVEWFAGRVAKSRKNAIADFDYLTSGRHPICDNIRDKLLATVDEPTLNRLFETRRKQLEDIEQINDDIRKLKSTYSDALLEKVANQKRSDSILPVEASKIKATLDEMNAALDKLQHERDETWNAIKLHPQIAAYSAYLNTLPVIDTYKKDQERYERALLWYPLAVLAAQTGFLLPLLLLAVFWNRRALDRQRDTGILISSHLILVSGIPIALRLLQFIRELLPDELLHWLLYQLEQWHIGFIWYYVLIFASIAGGVSLIFIAQRTLFTAARQRMTRLRKTLCRNCGEKLSSNQQAWCEICGAGQSAPCGQCGQPRRLLAFHCSHCGTSQPAPQ